MQVLGANDTLCGDVVATIGFFDGVHLGHQYLFGQLKNEAQKRGMHSMVVTFLNHPRLFFKPDDELKLLSPYEQKKAYLTAQGVDYALFLEFDKELATLTSAQFLALLAQKYGVKRLLVGYDHHFGSDREATVEHYIKYGRAVGVDVVVCEQFSEQQTAVSSSKIRQALQCGDIELANRFLGRRYSLCGVVEHGNEIGRQIGFPTANIKIEEQKLLPAGGVYAVSVKVCEKEYWGMMNIGVRPTIGSGEMRIEVNLFDFEGDIYGQQIEVEFLHYIRGEKQFGSLEELQIALKNDKNTILEYLKSL